MNKEKAIALNERWAEETRELIRDYKKVILSLEARVAVFEGRIAERKLDEK